jgi:hypothetical protein
MVSVIVYISTQEYNIRSEIMPDIEAYRKNIEQYEQAYADAQWKILKLIKIQLDGLQDVADHLDEKNAEQINKQLNKIKSALNY